MTETLSGKKQDYDRKGAKRLADEVLDLTGEKQVDSSIQAARDQRLKEIRSQLAIAVAFGVVTSSDAIGIYFGSSPPYPREKKNGK